MANIQHISNGEGGLPVRSKLNEVIDRVNAQHGVTLTPDNVEIYNPNKAGYLAGAIIAYSSATVGFETPKLFRALVNVPQGQSPETHLAKWYNEGDSFNVSTSNTATTIVTTLAVLRAIEGMKTTDTVTVASNGKWYRFDENNESGEKPNDNSQGSWVEGGVMGGSGSNDFDDIIPDPTKGKKLAKVKDDGTGLDYTDYGYDEVVQKAQTFNEGTLKKFDANGNDVDSGLTGESLDIYAVSPSLINALTNESNWRDGGGNPIVGEVAFASGIKGQRYYSSEFFYECIADNSWVRTYTGRPVINIYDNTALTLVFKGYLEDTLNWVGKIYVGTAITGVAQGTRHYDNDYVYEFFQTNVPIRYSRD